MILYRIMKTQKYEINCVTNVGTREWKLKLEQIDKY